MSGVVIFPPIISRCSNKPENCGFKYLLSFHVFIQSFLQVEYFLLTSFVTYMYLFHFFHLFLPYFFSSVTIVENAFNLICLLDNKPFYCMNFFFWKFNCTWYRVAPVSGLMDSLYYYYWWHAPEIAAVSTIFNVSSMRQWGPDLNQQPSDSKPTFPIMLMQQLEKNR